MLKIGMALILLSLPIIAEGSPVVVFADDFDDHPGVITNWNGVPGWTVSEGTVDIGQHGVSGVKCVGNAENCVDLDGSSSDAGILTSNDIAAPAGIYRLAFAFAGNNREATDESFTVDVSGLLSVTIDIPGADFDEPYQQFLDTFTVASDSLLNISFAAAGGDNLGPLLDNVVLTRLSAVPAPAAWMLTLLGVATLPEVCHRRRRR